MKSRKSEHKNESDVIIVGAGPTGLTLAYELLRCGISCRILDKAAAPGTSSRAIGIQARTLEVFDRMGIVEEIVEQGVRIGVRLYDRETLLLYMNFHFLANDAVPYPYGIMLPQNRTEELLSDFVQKAGGLIERQKEVTDVREEERHVVCNIHNMQDDTDEEIHARWLVGCDGAHSRVRKVLGLAFEGSTYDEEYLLGDVELDWKRSRQDVYIWMYRDGQFGVFPLPNKMWRLLATVKTANGTKAPQASVEIFQRLLREQTGDNTTTISNPAWMSNFKISRRMVNAYRVGRVFLAGDAAHVHSPFGGQGMNTGIQDAFNLAWKLALVMHGKAPEALLDTYQQERLPVARKVLFETDQNTKIFFANNLALRLLRNYVVIPLLRLGFVQRRMLWEASELGINYRTSVLSKDYSDVRMKRFSLKRWQRQALRAGDRAPDGSCLQLPSRAATTLFQEFRSTSFHLLVFTGTDQTKDEQLLQTVQHVKEMLGDEVKISLIVSQESEKVSSNWSGTCLLDPDRALHNRYGAVEPSLYFVRPDGYIGFCCQLVQEGPLLKYLEQWFVGGKKKDEKLPEQIVRSGKGL